VQQGVGGFCEAKPGKQACGAGLRRTPVSAEFSIGSMREANQHGGGNWRWIPNTGEYLVLGDIKVTMKNRGGMKLLSSEDAEYEVTLAGAYDREYNSDKAAQGNIYNNTGTGFTAVVLDQGDSAKILSNGTLSDGSKTTVVENGKTVERYRYKYTGGQPFSKKRSGVLVTAAGGDVRLGIRPDKADDAYAGDDLLLIFKVKSKNSRGTVLSENDFRVQDSDYIAVYDKKLLWRANLYMDKPETALGNIDWNDAHPWTGEEGYGANEWNIPEAGYTGQAGGQIISLPSTKWHYGSKNADHIIRKSVSYDHQGWDDPFSYKEKIKEQEELLNQWYTSDGKKFSKPIYKWPANTTLFLTVGAYSAYMGEAADGIAKLSVAKDEYDRLRTNTAKRWNKDLASLKSYQKQVFGKDYGSNVSPYVTAGADNTGGGGTGFVPSFMTGVIHTIPTGSGESVTLDGKELYPYIPGLSDSLMSGYTYPSKLIGKITAGTDCLGFVQRSHAWKKSPYKAIGSGAETNDYRKKPIYWTSADSDIPVTAMSRFYSNDCSSVICNYVGKDIDNTLTTDNLTDTITVYDEFKYLVPGDVVYYTNNSQHIMIVSGIQAASGPDGRYVSSDITLFESVYHDGDSVYGVVNERTAAKLSKWGKEWIVRREK